MREHEAVSRCDAKMQDIMSTNVAPRNRRDDPDSHLAEPEVDETKLREIWKELARQLISSTTAPEHVNAQRTDDVGLSVRRTLNHIAHLDPQRTDDCYLIWRSYSARHDYALGALCAFNPFPVSHSGYTCESDFAALAGDWEEVRGDMFDAWTALVREDPVVRRLVEKSLEEERATHDESAS
jgi:hypothetical protein